MYRVDPWTGLWGASIPVMGAVSSQIFLQCVHFGPFYVYSIVPHPTTPPIWQMFQVLLVYFDHMRICLFMNGTFGLGNITCWPKCTVCVLEARIWIQVIRIFLRFCAC
ncbi:hypothetical protein FRACYDRAFT_254676 [Fragilariopsis cylindrus CCMP1102]|uniref:Uncharacterized protein n=1 Tax=Fragilariopsis cylindrus CCMP1102 TaxID=635003 RepID=A0A1E7EKE0_9STRA|nr:hypothetical protein FRACYDRAFT_254676 [Fragilariopsis cylindrus CCMP1102]|eukprot:OEU06385.1 hypothetical protein FRACYDRAFT_254676 [Fragilariopsis cylindrus CCMP1102]